MQLYSSCAEKLTYSCPSLAETSICLNYSVCAASRLKKNIKRGWHQSGIKGESQVAVYQAGEDRRANTREGRVQGSSSKHTPGGPESALGQQALGILITLSCPNSFWEEHLLWAWKLATVTINQDDRRQLLLFNESFNVWHYFVWYNHSSCF